MTNQAVPHQVRHAALILDVAPDATTDDLRVAQLAHLHFIQLCFDADADMSRHAAAIRQSRLAFRVLYAFQRGRTVRRLGKLLDQTTTDLQVLDVAATARWARNDPFSTALRAPRRGLLVDMSA